LFVAGYSGVGKTSLVHEIKRDVIAKEGVFVEGKFDQLVRTLPYSAWAQAITQLVHNWLAESEINLTDRRVTILEALGDNGQILIDIVPDLELIIGPQPDVPQLGGIENQNRFNYYFNRFITALATPEQPLVVFLDDMQWIDLASLNLIEALFAAQDTSCFLIIGAYRDNEVGTDHPLLASQERMRSESDRVTVLTLGDLAPVDVDHLLADTLQLTVADCRPLSQILVEKTAGNPFFTRQLLYALESDGLLRFDRERHRWGWEEDLHQSLQVRGNVVDLMIRKIQSLPVESQHTLSIAACIGNRFDTSILNTITGQEQKDVLTNLSPAMQGGLIIRSNGHFSFAHDRIQEAAYALIPESDLPKTHLEIGRLLLANITAEDIADELFAILGHLNVSRELIDTDSEKIELAVLNLKAGQKAKAVAAYSDAKKYIEIGEDGELAFLIGQYDQVANTAALIHANARRILDRVRIYMTQIEAATAQAQVAEGLELGLAVLRDLERPGFRDSCAAHSGRRPAST
jgi:predicted ATPase